MKVVWTPGAKQDRNDIWDFIAAESPQAAAKMDALFSKAAAQLAKHPQLGRVGRVSGTREVIPHQSYCLAYEHERDTVWVLALIHTARQWPPVVDFR